ncbi:MAG: biotin--[acetyl-CoA-carboxylase] ligase [Acidocella sp. 20-57-95]|nr:MAG: biotin--[acetyl-CoA-carboxylase] ligase [Acidocella sp. 20-57-95]OYV60418.1 MAG: biotin--[acetyl-CoA-carboxylase] ligase [Acidocella sp. 21-58-7]HQT63214.1 biotin--[acetyl-CoA-carboxylase] ligase [Acidocella sp.]HQU03540.1 biotin--[acetyl-CoA-carboxylase] ligase [Acidocella sp.]
MLTWRLEHFATLDSTSTYCAERARQGEAAGLAVLADQQTAGRGSRGRQWVSTGGNLYLSVLLRPEGPVSSIGAFPLLAGLALAKAVRSLLPGPAPAPMLKWPNDVLMMGAKLAGVLIDASPLEGRIDWLVIGIGLNLAEAPQVAGRKTTCLADYGVCVPPYQAAQAVLEALSQYLAVLHEGGLPAIQSAWLAAAHPVGSPLVITGNRNLSGTFAGLTAEGALQLCVENRIETLQTGDIWLEGQGAG